MTVRSIYNYANYLFGGSEDTKVEEITDDKFYDTLKKTIQLQQSTKDIYFKKLSVLQDEMFDTHKSLFWIMTHPSDVETALLEYKEKKELSDRTMSQIIAIIISLFIHNSEMIEKHNENFKEYGRIKERMSSKTEEKVLSNKPHDKQERAFIPYEKLIKIKDSLPKGSKSRLLFSMYLLIPPVRANYGDVKIYDHDHKNKDDNYIVLDNNPKIVLNKYKTSKTYDTIEISIPNDLLKEINDSLELNKREYLFTLEDGKPFTKKNTFSVYANRILKKETKNNDFCLTIFRHVYLSRKDIDLSNKTLGERKKISNVMGHSLDTQSRYVWK
jgi:hypothetical protein